MGWNQFWRSILIFLWSAFFHPWYWAYWSRDTAGFSNLGGLAVMWWAKSAPLVVTGLTELQNSWWAKAAALRSNPGIQLLNCGLFIFWLWTWTYIQVQIWYSIHISISISVLTEKKNSKPWVLQQKSCRKPNTNNQPLLSNNLKLTLKYALNVWSETRVFDSQYTTRPNISFSRFPNLWLQKGHFLVYFTFTVARIMGNHNIL